LRRQGCRKPKRRRRRALPAQSIGQSVFHSTDSSVYERSIEPFLASDNCERGNMANALIMDYSTIPPTTAPLQTHCYLYNLLP
jgi:hypothetical protein